MSAQQIALDLVRESVAVDVRLIEAQPTLLSAIKLGISLGGFVADKELYQPLGIDAGHWSRIHRGEAHFPVDKLCSLMDLQGNEAPLMWLCHQRGYDLNLMRKRESELEKQLRELRAELEHSKLKERVLVDALNGRITP